jgi:hypothetical protein
MLLPPPFVGSRPGRARCFHGWLRFAFVKDFEIDSSLLQRLQDPVEHARLGQVLVRDDQRGIPVAILDHRSDFIDRIASEGQLAGRCKCPERSHE